jgi:hypothetical protein
VAVFCAILRGGSRSAVILRDPCRLCGTDLVQTRLACSELLPEQ